MGLLRLYPSLAGPFNELYACWPKSSAVLTVANDVAFLIFCYGEERWPFYEVVKVEIEVVILGQRVEVREVHTEKVLRTKCAEGSHPI